MAPDGSDFVVREIVNGRACKPTFRNQIAVPSGQFTSFLLTKYGVAAETAYRDIAHQLGVSRGQVTDYGMKDSAALTAQVVVVEGDYVPRFAHSHMWLYQIGAASGRLQHGGHDANFFQIKVHTDGSPGVVDSRFMNLFGPQRFGDGYLEVGRLLLEGDNTEAARILNQSQFNGPDLDRIMKRHRITMKQAMHHPEFAFQLRMKVQSWQSHLWNLLAPQWSEEILPMWLPKHAALYRRFWNPNLAQLDGDMLRLLSWSKRPLYAEAKNHMVSRVVGGFLHEFQLRTGAFATSFLASCYELADASRAHY